MSNKVPRVFISATSRDLGSFRKAVSEILVTLNALPVVQDHFGPDYRSVVEILREKIGQCDAAICLVGRCYGREPHERASDRPRRSYTQLEYETAVELGKPVFVFVADDDCPLDGPSDEPEELRGLQLEHIKRIAATDRIRMPFHSLSHLTDLVRVMRFDPRSLAEGVTRQLVVLMRAELLDGDRSRRGDEAWVREVVQPFQDLLQEVLKRWGGVLQAETAGEYEANFATADATVNAALALHQGLHGPGWQGPALGLRVGIHVGQIVRFGGADESRELQVGRAMDVCRRLTRMAAAGQTLLTRIAFDVARESVGQAPSAGGDGAVELSWRSHGRYLMSDSDESQEVCEVGVTGQAPLTAPPDSTVARRADSLEESQMQGWRPGLGQEIPRRPGWIIERKLGEGGFGEVWVARHEKTREHRVFKFCFDPARLSSFKRELTLFRLLRSALGHREDIARLLEVELDEAPFYLESEFVEGGNLRDWGGTDGHLASLPLEERLRLVAEIGGAVAAAHSVGIIHKDLKPTNVFMRQAADGRWHPILADFGIGAVADRSQLEQRGITVTGFTQSLLESGSSRTGTRMYQPPEANLARPATVQGDVYALGVLLFQMIVGDFDQPLGHGWERRLDAARGTGFQRVSEKATGQMPVPRTQEGEASSEPLRQMVATPSAPGTGPLRALDPTGELVFRLLRDDIGDCVDGDPGARLASAAQLVERLQGMDKRVTDGLARRRAERAAIRMRRLRAALAASVAALIVVGGLGVFAFAQWRRAEVLKKAADEAHQAAVDNEKRAVDNEKKARANAEAASQQSQLALDTLNAVIFDIQGSVANLSGSSRIRQRLLGTALKRLEQLSGKFVQRSTADRHTAIALLKMGDLVLQFGEAPRSGTARGAAGPGGGESRGAAESARRFYTRSMEIFQALAQTDPNSSQAKRDLSISYNRLGDVHLKLGATDKALQAYQKGLGLSEALAQADPNDAQAKRDLSISYNKLGNVHLQLGATDKALQAYQKDLEVSEALAQADPNDAQAKRDLSVSYDKLGDVHLKLGATDKALQAYQKSLGLRQALAQADPNDAQAKRDLSVSYNKLGDVHLQLGATDKALQSHQKSLELRQALAQADPNNAQAKRDLSYSLSKIAQALEQSNDLIRAREWNENRLAVDKQLSERMPKSANERREVAGDYERLSQLCARSRDWPVAVSYARQALDHARAARDIAGANQPFQWDFSVTLLMLGNAQIGAGQFKEARQSLEEAVQAGPQSADAHNGLGWLLATCWEDSIRDGKKAIGLATKACELSEWKNPDFLDTLAAAYAEAGQFDDAVKWQKKALEHPEAFDAAKFEQAKQRLKLYEARQPYHEPRPAPPGPASPDRPASR